MSRHGKKYLNAAAKLDYKKKYLLAEGINLAKEISYAKFNETLDIAIKLGVDPRQSNQAVRGSVILPQGIGKKLKVLVFCKGEKEKEAEEAGADYLGAEELIARIQQGWLEFDRVVSTPDMMGNVGKLGRILGPRGLMPNPKTGTVTFDLKRIIKEIKLGRIEFKVDRTGIVHSFLGKLSFSTEQLSENGRVFLAAILKAKPAASKGQYLKGISISASMGPGIKIDHLAVMNSLD